jgi:hypothetical protein
MFLVHGAVVPWSNDAMVGLGRSEGEAQSLADRACLSHH